MNENITPEVLIALRRPLDYRQQPLSVQWEIDERLGIADWEPTVEEARAYVRLWNEKVQATKKD